MMYDYFTNLVEGIEARLTETPQGQDVARKRFALETARLGARLFTPGQKVAWCGVLAPYDLLNALGVTSCFVEFVGAMLASTGGVEPMLESAEQTGWATDTCSYHRSVCGAATQGLMPEPDFLVATTSPCTGGLAALEHLAHHFKKDLFVIQVPNGKEKTDIEFLADQFRAMTEFVVDHTGQPLDESKLAEAMELTNQTRELLVEVNRLAASVPSPARRQDLVNFGIVMGLFLGTPGAVEVARIYRDEFARKVEAGISGIPKEKVRLMWLQNRIQFKNPLAQLLEEEFGAAVVLDELNDVNWKPIDPADPWEGMARRALSIPLTGPAEGRIDNLKRLAQIYEIDGAINPCQWGCRQGTGVRGLVEEGLKQVGVPVQNLEVDCVDPRHFAVGQLRTRLEAFVEMLGERRASRA